MRRPTLAKRLPIPRSVLLGKEQAGARTVGLRDDPDPRPLVPDTVAAEDAKAPPYGELVLACILVRYLSPVTTPVPLKELGWVHAGVRKEREGSRGRNDASQREEDGRHGRPPFIAAKVSASASAVIFSQRRFASNENHAVP